MIEAWELIDTYWNVKKNQWKVYCKLHCELIDTYWNVKVGGSPLETCHFARINRYILECKEEYVYVATTFTRELIDTYWNVK